MLILCMQLHLGQLDDICVRLSRNLGVVQKKQQANVEVVKDLFLRILVALKDYE